MSFSGPEQSSSPASQLFCIAATVGAAPVFSMKPASERRKRAWELRDPGTAQVAVGLFPRLAVPALAARLRLRTRAELRVLARFSAVRVAVAVVLRPLALADDPVVAVRRRDESREDTESEHFPCNQFFCSDHTDTASNL